LVLAGADRQARGGDGLAAQHSNRTRTGVDDNYDTDADGEEDEGIGMEDDGLQTYGPDPPSYSGYDHLDNSYDVRQATDAGWNWPDIGNNTANTDNDDDAASDRAVNDNEDDDGTFENRRILEDFGDNLNDDFGTSSMHQNSPNMMEMAPILHDYENDIPDLGQDGIGRSFQGDEGIGASGSNIDIPLVQVQGDEMIFDEEELPVAEVHIEDSPKFGGEEQKKSD
jgi:hypothetical protein